MFNLNSLTYILAALLCFGVAGCSTTSSPQQPEKMVVKGMTKDQVISIWGKPSAKQVSSSGEIWTWGGQNWKRMIPYAGPFINVQTAKVVFGVDGRVKDYRLTDKGDMMSQMESYMPGALPW
jgi:hypothetical protein